MKEKLAVACRQFEECKADLESERVKQVEAAKTAVRKVRDSGSSGQNQSAQTVAAPDDSDDELDSHAGLILSLSAQIATLDEELRAANAEITRLKNRDLRSGSGGGDDAIDAAGAAEIQDGAPDATKLLAEHETGAC